MNPCLQSGDILPQNLRLLKVPSVTRADPQHVVPIDGLQRLMDEHIPRLTDWRVELTLGHGDLRRPLSVCCRHRLLKHLAQHCVAATTALGLRNHQFTPLPSHIPLQAVPAHHPATCWPYSRHRLLICLFCARQCLLQLDGACAHLNLMLSLWAEYHTSVPGTVCSIAHQQQSASVQSDHSSSP